MALAKPIIIMRHEAGAGYPTLSCTGTGTISASLQKANSLWSITSTLADGATLRWDEQHGDEAIYVVDGAISVDDAICPTRGSVVIESGVPTELRAVGDTRLVHFGCIDPVPPTEGPLGAADPDNHAVRVVPESDAHFLRQVSPDGATYDQYFYADSSSPTSRMAIFSVAASKPSKVPPHYHTQDEIIHVLEGTLHIGTQQVGVGEGVSVKANTLYSFFTKEPVEFLNYRNNASYVYSEGQLPVLELAENANGMD